jgi:hypothetical protein
MFYDTYLVHKNVALKTFLVCGSTECHSGFCEKSLNKHTNFEILQKI